MSVPVDVLLQLLHERSFCAVPVANAIGNNADSEGFSRQRRRRSLQQRRRRAGRRSNRREDLVETTVQRRNRDHQSLADKLLIMAKALLDKEDEERARKKEERAKKIQEGTEQPEDEEDDIDDDETVFDEKTCRNTAINALAGHGLPVTEEAIAKKVEEYKERERATLLSLRLQRAMDTILCESLAKADNEGFSLGGIMGEGDDDDDQDEEMDE